MALSQEDKLEIMEIFRDLVGGGDDPVVVQPEPEPEPADPSLPDPNGPFAPALGGVVSVYQYLTIVNDFSAERDGRFTRSDIYRLMASVIEFGLTSGADWVLGSEQSWRFTKEAFITRASEVSGDVMTTEFPLFVSVPSSNGVDYGVTAHFFNLMTTALRRLKSQLIAQSGDRDIGPNGEILTNGECVRMCYVALDSITDMKIVPSDRASNFMKVRMECYNQYKAMGEGVFGPWAHPGSSTAWSWAGG